jgi:hypothetical protein
MRESMRTSLILLVSWLLGLALGIGTSWAKLRSEPDFSGNYDILSSTVQEPSQPKSPDGPQPRVLVEIADHDFGTVERDRAVEHTFQFANRGDAPLQLKSGGTSCGKCTISKIPAEQVLPGETALVVVQYNASIDGAQFRQTATILTNDPLSPRIELSVSGKVSSSCDVTPPKLVFSKLAAGEAKTAELKIISYLSDHFEIQSTEFTDPESAAFFEAQATPIAAGELSEPEAQCGYKISVTVKPGMPLGPVRQKLLLHTDLPGHNEIEVPIEGSVDSDITIAGRGWDRERGAVHLGVVRSSAGSHSELLLLVRGEQRHDVQISVGKCEPSFLNVSLGEPTDVNGGAVVRRPLIIRVPAGAPDADHMVKWGQITLETTHTEARQIRLFVQFAVEH